MKIVFYSLFVILFIESVVAFWIWQYSKHDETQQADVAIVLGAAVWDNKPSPVFKGRLDYSIELYEQGYIDQLIFTGGKAQGDESAESEVARDYALSKGVKADDIQIETVSTITDENLQEAKHIMLEHQFQTALIVSDPLHMKRAMVLAKHNGIEAYSTPTPFTQYKSFRSKAPFLLREVFYLTGHVVLSPFR
ncbi:MAG: YdcF family protein [Lysinibacillus sp.]